MVFAVCFSGLSFPQGICFWFLGQTTYTYDATGLFLQQVNQPTTANGIAHTGRYQFDSNTGLMLHMSGVNAQSCSGEYFSLGIIALSPYTHVIQAGGILNFRQYQTGPGAIGGLALYFSNNDISYFHSVPDTDGQDLGADATMNAWHYRTVDLSQFAGESLGFVRLINTGGAPPGQFDLYFDDIAVTSPDGTVLPVFSKTPGMGFEAGVAGPAECVSNLAVTDETSGASSSSIAALAPKDTTTYYHGDQIGSARLLTVGGGWAVWSGTYTSFGQEINPAQINPPNFYKFTGKERDEEEGSYLDYFGARYYNSTMGRFMSPDHAEDETIPVALPFAELTNPQTLNLYGYVQNNPLSSVDPDGHATWGDCADGSGSQCLFGDFNGEANQQNGRTVYWNAANGNWDNNDPTKMNDGRINDLSGGQLLMAAPMGRLLEPVMGKVGEILTSALGKTGETAASGASQVVVSGSKSAVRDALNSGAISDAQKGAVKRALARGKMTDTFTVEKLGDGSVKVTQEVAGRAGGHATYEKIVDASGNTVPGSVVQRGYMPSGEEVHTDSKY